MAPPEGNLQPEETFEELLKKTIFIDSLNTQVVSKDNLKYFLEQWADVYETITVPDVFGGERASNCAFARFSEEREAKKVVHNLNAHFFMCGGTPRPIRAQKAVKEMFPDRPKSQLRKIPSKLVAFDEEVDGAKAKEKYNLACRHMLEIRELKKRHRKLQEALAREQKQEIENQSPFLELAAKLKQGEEDRPQPGR